MDIIDGNMADAVRDYLSSWGLEADADRMVTQMQWYLDSFFLRGWNELTVVEKNELWANAWNALWPEAPWE